MIRAFELAVRQLSDPRLRAVIWQSLALSIALQAALAFVAWWSLQSMVDFQWQWLNEAMRWLGAGAVIVLALMLFPACFGIVITVFLERIADIVEDTHYPGLGRARGIPLWTGLWSGIVFLLSLIALNLVMLPFYVVGLFIAGLGPLLFYGVNGWLAGREFHELVALRRLDPRDVKAWRKANSGILWATGIAIVFLGTVPILNLIVPVLGVSAMVHVARTLKSPHGWAPGSAPPFHPPVPPG